MPGPLPAEPSSADRAAHAEKAWSFYRSIGSPKYHVAPMVDQSELAFRLLCRRHGATAAYTPMLHARLFVDTPKYRAEHFTTCAEDRPLFVQFCANDPATLLEAARLVAPHCDAVDLNLGCPQRIARRGRYGAFLMDDLGLVEHMVRTVAEGAGVPVTVKIRVFPELEATLRYARMLEAAGASLIAVHGRTREQKDAGATRADWDAIRAVKQAVSVPVLANGNIRHLADCGACLAHTGADGVMSAESLLEDPALFSPVRSMPGGAHTPAEGPGRLLEYLDLVGEHETPFRMVRGHAFKLLGGWLTEHHDLRERVNAAGLNSSELRAIVTELNARIAACGRSAPQPRLTERAIARLAREAALAQAMDSQAREDALMQRLNKRKAGQAMGQQAVVVSV